MKRFLFVLFAVLMAVSARGSDLTIPGMVEAALAGSVSPFIELDPTDVDCLTISGLPDNGSCNMTCCPPDAQGHKCAWCDPVWHPNGCGPGEWTLIGDCWHQLIIDHNGETDPNKWLYSYKCYGVLRCDDFFPPLPARFVPQPGMESCELSCWNAYLSKRIAYESYVIGLALTCPKTVFISVGNDPVECNMKWLYECGCLDLKKEFVRDLCNGAYQEYRHCYFVNCAPCTGRSATTVVPWTPQPPPETCNNPACYAAYSTGRTSADAAYAAMIAAAKGDCDLIAQAEAWLIQKDAALHSVLLACCDIPI